MSLALQYVKTVTDGATVSNFAECEVYHCSIELKSLTQLLFLALQYGNHSLSLIGLMSLALQNVKSITDMAFVSSFAV